MSSLAAITLPLRTAFMSALLLPIAGVGATDALGRNRGDRSGLERDLPGAPHVGPPFLVLVPLCFAHEVQHLVLAKNASDRELHVGLRLRHDQRVGDDVGRGGGRRRLLHLLAGQDEIGAILALIAVNVDGRGDQSAVDLVPAIDGKRVVISLADKALGENHVGRVLRRLLLLLRLLLRMLPLGASWGRCERKAEGKACGEHDAQDRADANHDGSLARSCGGTVYRADYAESDWL